MVNVTSYWSTASIPQTDGLTAGSLSVEFRVRFNMIFRKIRNNCCLSSSYGACLPSLESQQLHSD